MLHLKGFCLHENPEILELPLRIAHTACKQVKATYRHNSKGIRISGEDLVHTSKRIN